MGNRLAVYAATAIAIVGVTLAGGGSRLGGLLVLVAGLLLLLADRRGIVAQYGRPNQTDQELSFFRTCLVIVAGGLIVVGIALTVTAA